MNKRVAAILVVAIVVVAAILLIPSSSGQAYASQPGPPPVPTVTAIYSAYFRTQPKINSDTLIIVLPAGTKFHIGGWVTGDWHNGSNVWAKLYYNVVTVNKDEQAIGYVWGPALE